jgi:hypothetical protein
MSHTFIATWMTAWGIAAFVYGLYLARRPEPTDADRERAMRRLHVR